MPDPLPPPGPHPDRHHIAHASARLSRVLLEGEALTRLSPILEADRAQAVADLEAENRFAPIASATGIAGLRCADIGAGPFVLRLSIHEGRLVFDIRRDDDALLGTLALALGPFRGLIKDYQMLVDSHIIAMEEGREARIQAIDMGRRGLHNEGAQLLAHRLEGRVAIDFATARRLFTLVCVLHHRI
jgi:uncharacterized protein (UPF0262 family)